MKTLKLNPDEMKNAAIVRGTGCNECSRTGYRGRMGIYEIFQVTEEVRRLIYEKVPSNVIRTRARELGMRTLREDGVRKIMAGITTPEEVISITDGRSWSNAGRSSDDESNGDRQTMSAQMEDLLQVVVDENGSDLHIRVGVPPVIRLHGRLIHMDLPVLTAEDTERLMKSITSESHIQKVREQGGTDFGFAYGDMARFRVSVFKERGNYGVVLRQIPNKLMSLEQSGCRRRSRTCCSTARSGSGDGSDGFGQNHDVGLND